MSLEREERLYDFDVPIWECDLAIFVDNYSKEWKANFKIQVRITETIHFKDDLCLIMSRLSTIIQ
jgi:hypothetical protein